MVTAVPVRGRLSRVSAIDLETTGLYPSGDTVVEIAVIQAARTDIAEETANATD
jgi:DNA polymerase III epsilon subunit-like protein